MISVYKIILGVFAGSLILVVMVTQFLKPPQIVAAQQVDGSSTDETQPPNESGDRTCIISDSYPAEILQWCNLIMTSAETYALDPNLIAALILQESGGQADAYSSSGAVGLMQVMPRDGIAESFICINGPCFASRPLSSELYNPQFNIEYGTRMLKNLYDKHGDLREALYAYGPMDIGYRYADIVLNIYKNHN